MEEDVFLPESFQSKLFDLTGPKNGGSKGFLMFYVNGDGDVATLQKTENGAIALALYKAAEIHTSEDGVPDLSSLNSEG